MKKRVLIIDAMNNFIRNYVVMPHLSKNGDPIGGIIGFLLSLQKISRETRPNAIVIAWDGQGGSLKRKQAVTGYKDGRKPIRLNRSIDSMPRDDEEQNKAWQQIKLFEILNQMPVIQLMFDNVEADDIIAYTAKSDFYKDWQKIIVSSDKDFFQLLDENTIIYRPIQKEILNMNHIIEKHGIHPNNFALARSISGDASDNLPGVNGVGLKTVADKLPFLKEQKSYDIEDLVEYCKNVEKKYKAHNQIVENKDLILKNYQNMQLYAPLLTFDNVRSINETFENIEFEFNNTEFTKLVIKEGFADINFTDLSTTFKRIVRESKEKSE